MCQENRPFLFASLSRLHCGPFFVGVHCWRWTSEHQSFLKGLGKVIKEVNCHISVMIGIDFRANFDVIVGVDGTDVVQRVVINREKFDLILLDERSSLLVVWKCRMSLWISCFSDQTQDYAWLWSMYGSKEVWGRSRPFWMSNHCDFCKHGQTRPCNTSLLLFKDMKIRFICCLFADRIGMEDQVTLQQWGNLLKSEEWGSGLKVICQAFLLYLLDEEKK